MTKSNKIKGFSLLEILFVIVILASLSVIWVVYSQTKSTKALLEKTAEQMQQITQAGRSYFLAEEYYWPENFSDMESKSYLSQTTKCSSWQVTTAAIAECAAHEPFVLYYNTVGSNAYKTAKMFGVSLTLPDEQLAKQLYGLLPLGMVNGRTVTAVTTFPAVASDLHGRIIAVGTVRNNQNWPKPSGQTATGGPENGYVKKPNCPDPLVPFIFFNTYGFMLSHMEGGGAAKEELGIDVWCESNDPDNLSSEKSYCCGYNCPTGTNPDYAYSGPQHCDYARDLHQDYWRLNYYSCQNFGTGRTTAGKEGALIYFTTCLLPSEIKYPGFPYFDAGDINDLITRKGGNNFSYHKPDYHSPYEKQGCYYPTSCNFKNSPFDTKVPLSPFYGYERGKCQYKRRRCFPPIIWR